MQKLTITVAVDGEEVHRTYAHEEIKTAEQYGAEVLSMLESLEASNKQI